MWNRFSRMLNMMYLNFYRCNLMRLQPILFSNCMLKRLLQSNRTNLRTIASRYYSKWSSTINIFVKSETILNRNMIINFSSVNRKSSTFQKNLLFCKKQADASVLIELSSKANIPCVITSCKKYGGLKSVFSYKGESENVFLLLEFEDAASVKNLLSDCHFASISDSFPTSSRILCFHPKQQSDSSSTDLEVKEETLCPSKTNEIKSVSEAIEDLYTFEKLSELSVRLRFFFCSLLRDSLSGLFPECEVLPFGSSVNGIGRHGCDLDIMIRQYPAKNKTDSEFTFSSKTCIGNPRDLQKKSVFVLGDILATFVPGIYSMKKIIHARVPIAKFSHNILGMDCDISVNNMSAVLMSEIIYYAGEIDPRVHPLVHAVKKWAREALVTYDTPGSWITNFALTLLVMYFLQSRPVPILPPFNDVLNIVGEENSAEFAIEYCKSLQDLQTTASSNKESLAILLKEFLAFLGEHPFENRHYSVLTGKVTHFNSGNAICVQYPLEEGLNVTKNVSRHELSNTCEKARLSSCHLTSSLQTRLGGGTTTPDLSLFLGIPNILKVFGQKRLDPIPMVRDDFRKRAKRKTF